ncbi:hypothetical protein B0T14DRAFT_561311 [Immersiella caudata]|uniref:DUF6590 domain-containing protein n=1 Tax=Immersiella caudata TaxID=314043 RepID=A0AA40CCH7_9PEZI|nr:hypothetical protein B0T14DRAFT_561311 [Immersiella caudata]
MAPATGESDLFGADVFNLRTRTDAPLLGSADEPDSLGVSPALEISVDGGPEKEEKPPGDDGGVNHAPRQKTPEPGKAPPPGARRTPAKDYGWQWEWDEDQKDYIYIDNGRKLLYTAYQRSRGDPAASEFKTTTTTTPQPKSPKTTPAEQPPLGSSPVSSTSEPGWVQVGRLSEDPEKDAKAIRSPHNPSAEPVPPVPSKKRAFEEPLDDRFKKVEKPKRFFSVGRIFKTVWFEPRGSETPVRRADLEWSDSCTTPFHGKRPLAKFRWFVVVRKRLNHSLCFSITTFAGPGTARSRRGRAMDFVVLHSSEIEPPMPYEEEGIVRKPIGVIIEEDEQYISPLARLDCSRLYTVEDDLEVMKIGRVNPESLIHLEEYYKECVN